MTTDEQRTIPRDQRSSGETGEISIDLNCIGCGYNLRGLSADGRCPECGEPVETTLRRSASPKQLAQLRDAAQALGWFLVLITPVVTACAILRMGGLVATLACAGGLTVPLAWIGLLGCGRECFGRLGMWKSGLITFAMIGGVMIFITVGGGLNDPFVAIACAVLLGAAAVVAAPFWIAELAAVVARHVGRPRKAKWFAVSQIPAWAALAIAVLAMLATTQRSSPAVILATVTGVLVAASLLLSGVGLILLARKLPKLDLTESKKP